MWRKKKNEEMQETQNKGQKPEFAEEKTDEQMQEILGEYLSEDHSPGKKKKGEKRRDRDKEKDRDSGKTGRLKGILNGIRGLSGRKKLGLFAILALVLFVISRAACPKKEPALMVSAVPLEKGDVTEVLSLNGPVSGTESADVVSNLHAEVLEIMVREGDRVEKGQTLARIDSSDAAKEVEMAQNSYELAVSEYNENIRDTQHNYEKAVQDYQTAQVNYNRNQVLFAAGDISQAEMEQVNNALRDAARQVDSFTVQGGRAVPDKSYELKVKSAQFELDQKKKDLENTEVKSPISGTVVRVNSKVGQFADKPEDEKPMFIVENLDSLEMEIAVSEYSIGKVQVGQKAEITADILNGTPAQGEIISISPTGEEKGGGSSERVVPATIRIDGESSGGLIAGITAKASIVIGEASGTFKVSQTALTADADGNVCVAAVDVATNLVHLIPVETGVESDLEVEIIPVEEGALTEGMMIIPNPAGLTEGMPVTMAQGAGV
ncbi:MAG: HlyD family efflux transporter periplasmic adaptor subunit [Clostridium sp.]|nr:HlyD family efflux transporter periplasmic adaptor subunit [Clostridium sp.]